MDLLADAPTDDSAQAVHLPGASAALVVAHPGHELRVHRWMELARPLVFVLTDGSGGRGEARIESSTAVFRGIRARHGSVYGRASDRAIYAAVLDHDAGFFTGLADELAAAFVADGTDYVVADAVEEYNPTHDVCRLVVDTAVRLASRALGRPIANYDFLLVGPPNACPADLRDRAVWLTLDADALARKVAAARSYPEMRGEVEAALERYGEAPFATECLRPAEQRAFEPERDAAPFYETYGEKQVAAGVYERVLRYREHVLPLAEALRRHGESGG